MPFAAGLGATDHVLGHEIAHTFQIDVAKRAGHDAFALPGWFIEGMAEYLSLGPRDAHTDMWVRDAAIHDRLPTMEMLDEARYSPYRFGHAFWSFLAGRFGDEVLGRALRSKQRGAVKRIEQATSADADALTEAWHESIDSKPGDRDPALFRPVRIAGALRDGARVHVGPALSPDGRYIMYMSERDRLSLDLFMAEAATGKVVRKIVSMAADPHFDSLQYIDSSGAWDLSGRRFAMALFAAAVRFSSSWTSRAPMTGRRSRWATLVRFTTRAGRPMANVWCCRRSREDSPTCSSTRSRAGRSIT